MTLINLVVKDVLERPVEFDLLSLPLYLVCQPPRLVRDVITTPSSSFLRP